MGLPLGLPDSTFPPRLLLLRPVRGLRLHNYKGKAFQILRTGPTLDQTLRTGPILDWCAGSAPTDVRPMAGQKSAQNKSLRAHGPEIRSEKNAPNSRGDESDVSYM